jgi:predicted transcriptional regulator
MPDSKITIRLPETIAAKLSEVADRHEVTRTAILLDLLATGLDDWQPARQRTAPPDVARLDGAIEVLRLELTEAIERIDRLERQANAQRRPTVSAQPRPTASDGKTFTTQELADRFGWDATNAARYARRDGWIEVGKQGKSILWSQVKPPKNEI